MELRPVGVTGILCVLGRTVSEETGAAVAALAEAVRRADAPGIVELIPSFTSLLVRFDPLRTDADELAALLTRLERASAAAQERRHRVVELPVCYGGAYGPDLAFVAQRAGRSGQEVIRLHSGRDYRIYMLGFLPGFPYLGGLDERLHTPRLATARTRIPAGSVGIGGAQTGVYPMESPGGWRLIGRTPLCLFDPAAPPRYQAGDCIRFIPISEEQYRAMEVSV